MKPDTNAPAAPTSRARETPSLAPALPAGLAARLAGASWTRNHVGQAGAAVYRVQWPGQTDLYLKHATGAAAGALADEMVRLRWLADSALLVPALEHFECSAGQAWLLTRAMPGRTAYQWLVAETARAPTVVNALAQLLRQLHALPVQTCPFNAHHSLRLAEAERRLHAGLIDESDFDEARKGRTAAQVWHEMQALLPLAPDPVVSHGDFSLDNVLLDAAGSISGLIDLGRVGVADRYQDLAILWNCLGEFGPALQQALLDAYGIPVLDDRKLRFHLCLDECF